MKRLFANVALSIGIGLTFMPTEAQAQPDSEYFRQLQGEFNTYCAAYDAGAHREDVLRAHKQMIYEAFPKDFWNIPNTEVMWQVNLMTLMSHDSSITYSCPEHSHQMGTAEEWYVIFSNVDMDAIEDKLMEGVY